MIDLWTHGGGQSEDPFLGIGNYIDPKELSSIRAGFAYATLAGVAQFVNAVQLLGIQTTKKSLVVGINQGITEPKAIRILRSLENTKVCVFANSSKPIAKQLFEGPVYHPKYLVAEDSKGGGLWIVGSANLTRSAIGESGLNFELAAIAKVDCQEHSKLNSRLTSWFNSQKSKLRIPNDSFLDAYSKARISALKANPDLMPLAEWSGDIASAKWLFIEVGAASGIARHQVEFTEGLAQFFGKLRKSRRDLRLGEGNALWDQRPLTPKVTSFGVVIYRLGMPTVNSGGEPIAQRAIKFERTQDKDRFNFEIADCQSQKHTNWMSEASLYGHLGKTSGGRRFGYAAI